jgi:hypothetical protein
MTKNGKKASRLAPVGPSESHVLGERVESEHIANAAQEQVLSRQRNKIPARGLPAARVDPRKDDPENVLKAARVVPDTADRVEIGNTGVLVGYWHDPRPRSRWDIGNQRVCDVERAIMVRHVGGPCDTDDGDVYFVVVANALAHKTLVSNSSRGDPLRFVYARLRGWAAEWTPRIPEWTIDRIIRRALAESRWWRADTAAKLLRLTMAERTEAGITTIGAVDVDKEAREKLRKERKRAAQRSRDTAERRAAGATAREQYEAQSIAALCRRLGISRMTYYRDVEAGRDPEARACDRLPVQHNKSLDSNVGQTTCNTTPMSVPDSPPISARQQAKDAWHEAICSDYQSNLAEVSDDERWWREQKAAGVVFDPPSPWTYGVAHDALVEVVKRRMQDEQHMDRLAA